MKRIVLIVILFLVIACEAEVNEQVKLDTVGSGEAQDVITFRVSVPHNSAAEDIIYFERYQPEGIVSTRMKKIGMYEHEIVFSLDELEYQYNDFGKTSIKYRYTRNNAGYLTSEFYPPDSFEHLGSILERESFVEPGVTIKDTIERWRWFPPDTGKIERTSALDPLAIFDPRLNNTKFRSGQALQDLYLPEFDEFFDSTAKHMKKQGYTWVYISPPWDWKIDTPKPKLLENDEGHPNYPEGKLAEHIIAFKKQGLKVYLAPQICCSSLDMELKDAEWWESYYQEIKRFLVYHAGIASSEDVDTFLFDIFDLQEAGFEDYEDRVWDLLAAVKKEYPGQIAAHVWNFFPGDDSTNQATVIPEPDYFFWSDDIDVFTYQMDVPLSLLDNPSDVELLQTAGRQIDGAKVLYETFDKPIILLTTYPSLETAWKGSNIFDIQVMNYPWVPERDVKHTFSGSDQARVVHALFGAIADRPWVIGFFNFGYWHWDMPLVPDMSVRGKPAEDVWRKWNQNVISS
tara:strand:- start:2584 stop:4125 length:1542 start_codon:yes stop_codon:yes gene_type:complete